MFKAAYYLPIMNTEGFQVLNVDDIPKMMEDAIALVADFTKFPKIVSRILLGQYRWCSTTLLQSFTEAEDGESFLRERNIFLPLDTDGTLKTKQGTCEICYEELQVSSLSCNDTVCSDCWIQYLEMRIGSDAKDQVSCPGAGCQMYLEDKVVLSFLSGNNLADEYKRIILNSCLESSYSLRRCAAKCTNVFQSKVGDGSGVTCSCGKTFCFNCSSDWHAPVTCLHLKMWTKKCNDDIETMKWLNANTKDCPKCRRVIEKTGGCNHMICKRCSYEFCWVCLGPWNEHGTSYYSCNRYDSSSSKDARAKVSNAQELETRYSFYCTRFNNHRQSTVIKQKLSDSLQHRMKYSFIHMQYVRRAFQVMYESREVLMYTYPFAYYLDHSGHEVRIFESAQQHLEHDTEILGELLERRLKNEDDGKLKDLMPEVISKTNCVDQRMKTLLKICEEGYVQRHWKFICE